MSKGMRSPPQHKPRPRMRKHKPRIQMFKRRISRQKQMTEKVISPRYPANLMEPGKSFKATRESIESDCFAKFEYDPTTFSLKVWFWGYKKRYISGVYILWDIAQWEYEEFLQASSKGRHFYYLWRWPNGSRKKPYTKVG